MRFVDWHFLDFEHLLGPFAVSFQITLGVFNVGHFGRRRSALPRSVPDSDDAVDMRVHSPVESHPI